MEKANNDEHETKQSPINKSIEKHSESFLRRLNQNVIEPGASEISPNEYRNQYETLLGALKLSTCREVGLMHKCLKLENENTTAAAELQLKAQTIEENERLLRTWKKDLDTVQSLLDSANDKRDGDKVLINTLQAELDLLKDQVQKSERILISTENEKQCLAENADIWKEKAESASKTMDSLHSDHRRLEVEMEEHRMLHIRTVEKNELLEGRLLEKERELHCQNERQDALKKELEELKMELKIAMKNNFDMQYNASEAQNNKVIIEKQLHEVNQATAMKDLEISKQAVEKENLALLLDDHKKKISVILDELRNIQIEHKEALVERNRLAVEKSQLESSIESERKQTLHFQQLLDHANTAASQSNYKLQLLENDLDIMTHREKLLNEKIAMLKREHGNELERLESAENALKSTKIDLFNMEQNLESLKTQLANERAVVEKQSSISHRWEKECDELRNQLEISLACNVSITDDLRKLNNNEKDLSRKIEDLELRIDDEQKKNNATKTEYDGIFKQLTDIQSEVKCLENDRKRLYFEVDSLQSVSATKDAAIAKASSDYQKEVTQTAMNSKEISNLKSLILERDQIIKTLESDVKKLNEAACNFDDAAALLRKESDQLMRERDILGTQLIRRNVELALLKEKINVQQKNLRNGEQLYNSRLDDIRLLKMKVKEIQSQRPHGGQQNIEDHSKNLILLQKELVRERLKVKALSDELENPINIHRWRKLEGSDPVAYEMIQKIHILQKRLLLKTEEVIEKNDIIKKQEQHRVQLEIELTRKPGLEITKELNFCQNDVRKKSMQMKAMAGELNMHQTQMNEYKREIDRLAGELHSFKQKYFDQKQREAAAKEKEIVLLSELAPTTIINPSKDQLKAIKQKCTRK